MTNFALGYIGTFVLMMIIVRGVWTGIFKRYPLFYLQLLFSLVAGLSDIWIWEHDRAAYGWWYWDAEFVTMLAACANLIEIHRYGFAQCPRAEPFGKAIRYALYAAVIGFTIAYLEHLNEWRSVLRFVALERDFRAIQALLLVALVGGVFYFGVPLSRNVKGILVGYGSYVGASLVTLAVESRFPKPFQGVWNQLEPLFYTLALVVYLVSLWQYSPAPVPRLAVQVSRAREQSFVS